MIFRVGPMFMMSFSKTIKRNSIFHSLRSISVLLYGQIFYSGMIWFHYWERSSDPLNWQDFEYIDHHPYEQKLTGRDYLSISRGDYRDIPDGCAMIIWHCGQMRDTLLRVGDKVGSTQCWRTLAIHLLAIGWESDLFGCSWPWNSLEFVRLHALGKDPLLETL